MTKTRNGKIARLPRHIREELNRRMDDGETGSLLVKWLNECPAVRRVIDQEFGGREIREQNLSEWRNGGFQEWLQRQEAEDWARTLVDQAEALQDTAGRVSLADHLSIVTVLELGKLLREATSSGEGKEAERRGTVLAVAGALANLQRVEIEAEHARVKCERWQVEQDQEQERVIEQREALRKGMPRQILLQTMADACLIDTLVKGLPPDQAAELKRRYHELQVIFEAPIAPPGQSESGEIRPNPTESD